MDIFSHAAISLPHAVKNDSLPPMSFNSGLLLGPPLKMFSDRPLVALKFSARLSGAPDGLLDFPASILVQMDGLLFATFRVRLERDVCASSSRDSFCPFWGPSLSPASCFCGLFLPPPELLGDVIAACRLERGLGIFIGRYDCTAFSSLLADDFALIRFEFPHISSKIMLQMPFWPC